MNSFIELLNRSGANFLNFAWPMLWQSSLLIMVLFAFEYLFRRKVRAGMRYALWLMVLVKLCLPPTFASPTSPLWWLTPSKVVAVKTVHYTFSYDNAPLPDVSQISLLAFVPPKSALTFASWCLIFSVFISSALIVWLLVRWWQITRQIRRAKTSERLAMLAGEVQKLIGGKFNVPVKLTANSMSPAVCGLFRPAILIPQSLAENFSDAQLRAVLLHELIHLRRRDVWVNFVQALLQIFYWWHPLVWLANVSIRRVREEAVDDAVMLALRDEAETYAPTLLEVAKLALNRPLASLGLVGILESRHALGQRIERLVDFCAPRKAGLTFASACGIFVFSVAALPMGEAPASVNDQTSLTPVYDSAPQTGLEKTNSPAILIEAQIYRMNQSDFEKIVSDPAFAESKQDKVKNFQEVIRLLKSSGVRPVLRPRIQTSSGWPAVFFTDNWTNGAEFECRPFVTNGLIELVSVIKIISTTENVRATNQLNSQIILENGGGHVFSIKTGSGLNESNIVVTLRAEIVTNQLQRLQKILKRADGPNFETNENSTNLFSRHFRVETNTFIPALQKMSNLRTQSVPAMAKNLFKKMGVDLDLPGKSVFYNDGLAELFVRATAADLDKVEHVMEMFASVPPQIHIKARFLKVPKETLTLLHGFTELTNGVTILSPKDSQKLWQTMRSNPKLEDFAEPEVITTDRREIQMRATQVITIVTNFAFQAVTRQDFDFREFRHANDRGTNLAIYPQTNSVETGPILNIFPNVLPDDHTIHLALTASLTEFLGYDPPPTNTVGKYIKEYDVSLPVILPSFHIQQTGAHVDLQDGQTVVLTKLEEHFLEGGKELPDEPGFFVTARKTANKPQDKEVLIFITVTLVDPAGNPIHPGEVTGWPNGSLISSPVSSSMDYYDDLTPNGTVNPL
jgi:beta-lactamase regulating signal transducer with metallopeptidase domain